MQHLNEHIELIFKHLAAETNQAEKKQLFDWIEESDENKKIFNNYQAVWDMSGETIHPEIDKIDVESEWKFFKDNSGIEDRVLDRSPQINRNPTLRIVASAAAVFILVFAAVWFLRPQKEILYADSKVIESKLPDGTEISINKDSKVTYTKNYNQEDRKIELEGDAYFKVMKDKGKPFIINAESFYVEVLGTEFYVNSNFKERKVVVTKGTVAVYQLEDKSDQVILNAGDEIVFDTKENVLRKIQNFDENYLSWKTKVFNFNNQSLDDVFKALADVYDIQYEFKNENLKKCRLSVRFDDISTEDIVKVLNATFDNISFSKDSTSPKIYIDGTSCE
jgi:transmembrane sensor